MTLKTSNANYEKLSYSTHVTLDSNPTLISSKHGSIVTKKLVHVVLDCGQSILERGHIAGGIDRMRFHIICIHDIVDLLPIHIAILFRATYEVQCCGQPSFNQ